MSRSTMRRHAIWLLPVAGSLVWALACGSKKPPPPVIATQEAEIGEPEPEPEPKTEAKPETTAVATATAVPESETPEPVVKSTGTPGGPEISLLDAGKEPRKRVRHAFKKGSRQKLSMKGTTRIAGGAMAMPSFILDAPIEATIVELNDAGDAKFSYKAGPFKHKTSGGGMLGGMLGGLAGGGAPEKIAGWGWITPQGVIREQQVTEGPQDGEAPVETGDPFPEDPIGVGARWRVETTVVEKGTQYRQTTTYDLVKLAAQTLTTKMERVQEPLGGSTDPVAQSRGELVFKLGQVYPTGKLSMSRAVQVAIPGANKLQMSSEVTIKNR